jgi:uncharacterized protein YcaQ
MATTLDDLRRMAITRTLFRPTTLPRALDRLGFVQADPIRAPARAQDLTLRHRVRGYRAGDLERRYMALGVEEDFFVNYGFVTRSLQALMHPRPQTNGPAQGSGRPLEHRKRARLVLDFVRERGVVHPREVDDHFEHGTVTNYWGGSSNATTKMLDAMHYRGELRVVRREGGVRIYSPREHGPGPTERSAALDALVDVVVRLYAPLPGPSLSFFVRRLRYAVPQWKGELTGALRRVRERLSCAHVDGVDWYWLPGEQEAGAADPEDTVRFLAPFDPVVQDRARFERLWGWVYRFEAYTPAAKRKRGYYALPLLWRDRVIGWANVAVKEGELEVDLGHAGPHAPRDRAYRRELQVELQRMRAFLGIGG